MDRLSHLGHPTSFLHISHINTAADENRPDSISYHRQTTLRQLGSPSTTSVDSKLPHYSASERATSCAASVLTDQEPLRPPQPEEEAPIFRPGRRFYLAFSALAALSLVVALDGTSLSVALPIIAQDIGGKAIDAFWAGTSFLLASTVSLPTYAALSQIFGRKGMTLIAVSPTSLHPLRPPPKKKNIQPIYLDRSTKVS